MSQFQKAIEFARQHILLNNAHHLGAGFGFALILQHYLSGNPFLPVSIGWVLVGFSAIIHLYEFTR